ncbi:MAG TPA: MBL fold metallo-hydrolase [Jatrophihabitans sp.]|jgi:phosphoribosyl 1,2-cyclic phosphodiesterase|nr:MBL fold metallo-hydrolase [Jatrophihabitans sp.]
MRLVALGVRGSTPAPGADFVRYGGHTSCLAVYGDGDESPRLVLDAGTGLRELPGLTGGAPYRGDIVLSHLHWDHVQGLPFSSAVDRPDARVRLHVPVADARTDGERLLARAMSPPHFPIGPDGLLGEWRFAPLLPGRVDDIVSTAAIPHKGGTAYAIKVELDGVVLVYAPDHALHAESDAADVAAFEAFVRDADLLIHDGQYTEAEQVIAVAYGHATVETVMQLADRASVGRLVLAHHAPTRTDDQLDAWAARYPRTPAGRPVTFLRPGPC